MRAEQRCQKRDRHRKRRPIRNLKQQRYSRQEAKRPSVAQYLHSQPRQAFYKFRRGASAVSSSRIRQNKSAAFSTVNANATHTSPNTSGSKTISPLTIM